VETPDIPPGRSYAAVVGDTSGMVPRPSAPKQPGEFVVTAWYSDGGRRVRVRGQLLISAGVVSFEPFEATEDAVEISCPGARVTVERGRAPWSGLRLGLKGRASVTVAVPRHSQRRICEALSAAGVQMHEQNLPG
jgi:hypothetical protein